MGNDFAWLPVFAVIETGLPANVRLTGFDVTSGAAPEKDATGAIGLSGTITFDSNTPLASGPLIRRLRAIKGVASVDGSSLTESAQVKGAMVYTLDIAFDQSIYSGAYAAGGQ